MGECLILLHLFRDTVCQCQSPVVNCLESSLKSRLHLCPIQRNTTRGEGKQLTTVSQHGWLDWKRPYNTNSRQACTLKCICIHMCSYACIQAHSTLYACTFDVVRGCTCIRVSKYMHVFGYSNVHAFVHAFVHVFVHNAQTHAHKMHPNVHVLMFIYNMCILHARIVELAVQI